MKKHFLLFAIAIISFSCRDKEINTEHTLYHFLPRKVNYMITIVGKKTDNRYSYGEPEVTIANKDEWYISIGTLNFDPDTLQNSQLFNEILDDPIPEVERLILQDYEKSNQQNSSSSKGQVAMNLVNIDYRTSSIRNFNIYTLNASLFGKQAGESLNDFFNIIGYNPAIISTPNYRLIYGLINQNSIAMPIDEWLSLHPLGLVGMSLAPNKAITGLPLDVQFVVEMETDEGLVLRDTTQLFTITE